MFDKATVMAEGPSTGSARSELANLNRQPTVRERLEQRLHVLEAQAENIRTAIKALDDNPGSEAVLDALSKAGM